MWSVASVFGQSILVPAGEAGLATLGIRPHEVTFGSEGIAGHVLASRFGGNLWHTRVQVGDAKLRWPPGQTLVLRE